MPQIIVPGGCCCGGGGGGLPFPCCDLAEPTPDAWDVIIQPVGPPEFFGCGDGQCSSLSGTYRLGRPPGANVCNWRSGSIPFACNGQETCLEMFMGGCCVSFPGGWHLAILASTAGCPFDPMQPFNVIAEYHWTGQDSYCPMWTRGAIRMPQFGSGIFCAWPPFVDCLPQW